MGNLSSVTCRTGSSLLIHPEIFRKMVLHTAICALGFIEFSIYCPVKKITSANKLKETFQKLSNGKFLGNGAAYCDSRFRIYRVFNLLSCEENYVSEQIERNLFKNFSNGKFLGKVWKTLFSKRVFQEKRKEKREE